MNFVEAIEQYRPINEQEATDQKAILSLIHDHPHNILTRDNPIAHITSSGFIMNPEHTKVLLVHHNIRNAWAWTGGHADGDPDLLQVAIREAREETGILYVQPQTPRIASLDILPVFGHIKSGRYVHAHLHLSVAYILICDERETLKPQPEENSGVAWFDTAYFTREHFDESDVYLYNKLIRRAKQP